MTNNRDIHQQVLALLNGPTDYWDRPDCDWPGRAPQRDRTDDEVALARQSANTAYVMGSLALEQDNLDEAWTRFAMACDERHPGAAFRLAALTARRIGDRKAGSSGREAAGILAALCRAAERGTPMPTASSPLSSLAPARPQEHSLSAPAAPRSVRRCLPCTPSRTSLTYRRTPTTTPRSSRSAALFQPSARPRLPSPMQSSRNRPRRPTPPYPRTDWRS